MSLPSEVHSPELNQFAKFCSRLILENGRAMVLEDFQRRMLTDYFNGATETLILVSKKNGKSSLVAALCIYHLLTQDEANVVIAASSAKQAKIVFDQAAGMIRRSAGLAEHFKVLPGFKEIRGLDNNGVLSVLASGVDTADGVIPTLAIVDELHRHRTLDLYGVFRDGLGPRNGRLITISTAGDDELSPLGKMRDEAYKLPVKHSQGAYHYMRSANGEFVMHEWALSDTDNRDDLALVKTANPASWQTLAELTQRHDSPSMTEWQWARFACGVWMRGEDTIIGAADWDALADPSLVIPPGSEVYVGWDNAFQGPDTTALVPVWWQSDAIRVIGQPIILQPPSEGLDDREIEQALLTFKASYRVKGVVFDPNAGAWALARQIERNHRIPMVTYSQTDQPMALAARLMLEAIRRGEIRHNGDKVLRQHVLNAVEKPVAGEQFRFDRPKHGPRVPIDGLIAAAMAHATAVADHERKPSTMYGF